MSSALAPLDRFVLLGAGFVIIAAGLRVAAGPVNLILLSMLIAGTILPATHALVQRSR
jgi:hypothetical protein